MDLMSCCVTTKTLLAGNETATQFCFFFLDPSPGTEAQCRHLCKVPEGCSYVTRPMPILHCTGVTQGKGATTWIKWQEQHVYMCVCVCACRAAGFWFIYLGVLFNLTTCDISAEFKATHSDRLQLFFLSISLSAATLLGEQESCCLRAPCSPWHGACGRRTG